jgi:hypothetical protein
VRRNTFKNHAVVLKNLIDQVALAKSAATLLAGEDGSGVRGRYRRTASTGVLIERSNFTSTLEERSLVCPKMNKHSNSFQN